MFNMGSVSSKKKKITRTVVLSPPVLTPSGEVKQSKPAVQVASEVFVMEHGSPLYLKKLNTWALENAIHHHTKKFDLPRKGTLVVRRGQPFKLTLCFNRPYNSITDELKFFFETGENPRPGNNSMICLSSYTSQGSSGWKSDFLPVIGTKRSDGLQADLWIFTPADCIVSDWKFSVQTVYKSGMDTATVSYEHPEKIYILFNPWDKKDTVYHPTERMLNEYIMNPSGLIFLGTNKQKVVKPWIFGQFEPGILEVCIYIVKRAFNLKTNQEMGDPIAVARNVCTIINDRGNSSIIEEQHSTNDFSGGRSPSKWSGSVSILKQYISNAQEKKENDNPQPVKYGQNYVFAGLLTTVCRAVGIPCRCVTCYSACRNINNRSSFDFNYSFNESGDDIVKDNSTHAFWNFHVWNDIWMRRPDLTNPLNEASWHVLDSTPQQYSTDDLRCCGPAHLGAIKAGLTDVTHGVDCIYSQMNAKISHWLKLNEDEWTVVNATSHSVGENFSTKSPDGRPVRLTHKYTATITDLEMSKMRHDVTTEYKRRDASRHANRHCEHRQRRPLYHCSQKDVSIRFSEKEYIYAGEIIYVTAHFENTSSETRTLQVILYCESIRYNGERGAMLKSKNVTIVLDPKSEGGAQLKLKESNYIGQLSEQNMIREFVYMKVEETGQIEAMFEDFIIQKPILQLFTDENIKVDTNFEVQIKFSNPLKKSLTECSVSVEGTGLESMLYIRNFEDIPAECEWTGIVNLMPIQTKTLQLSVTFNCAELCDLTGSCTVQVKNKLQSENKTIINNEELTDEIDITGLGIIEDR